jgi:putative transferase (TIGR04331 family)
MIKQKMSKAKKTLWLVDSPDDITPNDVFFGAWCFENSKYSKSIKINEFESISEIRSLEKESNIIIENLIAYFCMSFNTTDNKNFSTKFLNIVLRPWLNALVHLVLLRIHTLKKIISKYEHEDLNISLMSDNVSWDFYDTSDFIKNGSTNKKFNFWLISRIIEKFMPDNWNLKYVSNISPDEKKIRNIPFREKLYNYLIYLMPILSVKGMGLKSAIILHLKLFLRNLKTGPSSNVESKNISYSNETEFDWEILAEKLLPSIFRTMKFKKKTSSKNKFILCCGSNLYYNEKLKFKIAQKVDSGDSLILTQHGGVYGSVGVHSAVNSVEYYNSDIYITWGWKNNSYNTNSISLPSPYLSKFNYNQQNDNIIFVESNVNLFSFRINSINLSLENLERRNNLSSIYNHLNNKLKKHFFYRPALSISGGGVLSDDFKKSFKENINIISGNLHNETMKAKVVLIDGPGTTMNILLSANVPTIAFWNYDFNFFDENSIEIIENLKKHGIIQKSSKDAAQKLNEIFHDIDSWWKNDELQKDLKKFNNNYGLKDSNYLNEWSKFIKNLK